MTAGRIDITGESTSSAQILFDPLSYIHPQRLHLPRSLDTPRQRAIVNRMLLGESSDSADREKPIEAHQHRLLQHWRRLPYVCSLVGAQLLKSDLAWRGRSLHLPAPVRFFMSLPLQQTKVVRGNTFATSDVPAAPDVHNAARAPNWSAAVDPQQQVLIVGLARILDWQWQAPAALLERMRLLFPPQLDACFDVQRKPLQATELFLISQAIQYAKNYPYHM